MKHHYNGRLTSTGYLGYVPGQRDPILFSTEDEYREYFDATLEDLEDRDSQIRMFCNTMRLQSKLY